MTADAATWATANAAALVGLPAAAAEQEAADAGLAVRIAGPGAVLTLEHRTDRVTLAIDEAGLVRAVSVG